MPVFEEVWGYLRCTGLIELIDLKHRWSDRLIHDGHTEKEEKSHIDSIVIGGKAFLDMKTNGCPDGSEDYSSGNNSPDQALKRIE